MKTQNQNKERIEKITQEDISNIELESHRKMDDLEYKDLDKKAFQISLLLFLVVSTLNQVIDRVNSLEEKYEKK